MSQQPNIILENPYFEPRCSVFEDQEESKCHGFDSLKDPYGSPMQGFRDSGSPLAGSSISTKSNVKDPIGRAADVVARDTHSPSSGNLTVPFHNKYGVHRYIKHSCICVLLSCVYVL